MATFLYGDPARIRVRCQTLVARNKVPGFPLAWLPTSSVGLQFACTSQHDQTSCAFSKLPIPVYMPDVGCAIVPQIVRNFCASCIEYDKCSLCLRSPIYFCQWLVLTTFRIRGALPNALVSGRPCLLYVVIFHAATKNWVTGKVYPAAIFVCDGH